MPDINGVKFSEFPQSSGVSGSDQVVGLQNDDNARFSFASILYFVQSAISSIFVPLTRKINNKALSADITLTPSDVGAVPTTREINGYPLSADVTLDYSDVGAVPATREINGQALTDDITLDADDVGARADDWMPSAADVGAQAEITASGILKGDGNGGVSAAVAGTDYQTPLVAGTDYATPAMIPTVPSAYTSNPEMDGTASPGSSGAWARGDHVHPSDTTKADKDALNLPVTASGSMVTFESAKAWNIINPVSVTINPVQSGSGDPSPSNVRPISGWTAANLWRTGKNLLPLRIYTGINYNKSAGTTLNPSPTSRNWTQNANSISYTSSSSYTAMSLMTGLLPPGKYSFKIKKLSTYALRYTRYALDRNFNILTKTYDSNVTEATTTYTLADYGYVAINLDSGSGSTSRTHEIQIQVEVGSSSTEYAPYNGLLSAINLSAMAGTIYGGTLDATHGILTVTKGNIASYNGETLPGEWLSSMDVYAPDTTPTIGAQVVYDLAPAGYVTYQLDPITLSALAGVNKIWADTGDVSVTYRAGDAPAVLTADEINAGGGVAGYDTVRDLSSEVQAVMSSIAPIESGTTASQAYAQGAYFWHGSSFCKALTAIASGGTFTLNTNYATTTVAAELLAAQNA